jgi:hypothetical protein
VAELRPFRLVRQVNLVPRVLPIQSLKLFFFFFFFFFFFNFSNFEYPPIWSRENHGKLEMRATRFEMFWVPNKIITASQLSLMHVLHKLNENSSSVG